MAWANMSCMTYRTHYARQVRWQGYVCAPTGGGSICGIRGHALPFLEGAGGGFLGAVRLALFCGILSLSCSTSWVNLPPRCRHSKLPTSWAEREFRVSVGDVVLGQSTPETQHSSACYKLIYLVMRRDHH